MATGREPQWPSFERPFSQGYLRMRSSGAVDRGERAERRAHTVIPAARIALPGFSVSARRATCAADSVGPSRERRCGRDWRSYPARRHRRGPLLISRLIRSTISTGVCLWARPAPWGGSPPRRRRGTRRRSGPPAARAQREPMVTPRDPRSPRAGVLNRHRKSDGTSGRRVRREGR